MIADALTQLSARWWTFLLRGIVALAIAVLAFTQPASTAGALVYLFAAYFLISGAAQIVAGFSLAGVGNSWLLILSGAVSALLGVMMLSQPGVGPLALAYLFATWTIMNGTIEIAAAVWLRSVIKDEFWWILLGIVTLAFGFYAIFNPGLGVLSLVYTLGFYATFAGIALIGFAFRIKGAGEQLGRHAAA